MKTYRNLALSVCLVMAGGSISLWADDNKADGRGDLNKEQRKLKDECDSEDANQPNNQASKGQASGTGINYHGGPVILGTTNIYYVWYGNWSGNSAQNILPDFASTIGGSVGTTSTPPTTTAPISTFRTQSIMSPATWRF